MHLFACFLEIYLNPSLVNHLRKFKANPPYDSTRQFPYQNPYISVGYLKAVKQIKQTHAYSILFTIITLCTGIQKLPTLTYTPLLAR